ncbi:MAG: hypothetical protein R6U25_05700, partial [Alkalispirochaeta sp.]
MPISILMTRITVVMFVLISSCLAVFAQEPAGADVEPALRRGFREILLGTPFERTQELLQGDSAFQYRGEPDVSLRLSDGGTVIDTRGRVYMDRGIFQFHEGQLFSIALYLDRSRLDYFQLYEQFRGRYG